MTDRERIDELESLLDSALGIIVRELLDTSRENFEVAKKILKEKLKNPDFMVG